MPALIALAPPPTSPFRVAHFPKRSLAVRAFITAIIYFGSFLGLGLIAKTAVSRFVRRRDIDLHEIQAQAGSRRGRRRIFLLGFWRNEGPD
jgi:hypothetical protein